MKRWSVPVDRKQQVYTRVIVEAETKDDAYEFVANELFDLDLCDEIFNGNDPNAEIYDEPQVTDYDYIEETTEELTECLIRKEVQNLWDKD